jgi:hypothetical protein
MCVLSAPYKSDTFFSFWLCLPLTRSAGQIALMFCPGLAETVPPSQPVVRLR